MNVGCGDLAKRRQGAMQGWQSVCPSVEHRVPDISGLPSRRHGSPRCARFERPWHSQLTTCRSSPSRVFLGVTPRDQDHTKVPQNHSPLFFADESALPVGVKVMTNLALDYLFGGK